MTNVAPDAGGVERDPMTIHAYTQPGAMDEELWQNAVIMAATVQLEGDTVVVQVDITNDQTVHHVPTDSPLRHLILLVRATDTQGNTLRQLDGPTVLEWGGVGGPSEGYYAGLPGNAFAKVLEELWTEVSPTGAYWNPTRVLSDKFRLSLLNARAVSLGAACTATVVEGLSERGEQRTEEGDELEEEKRWMRASKSTRAYKIQPRRSGQK